MRKFNKQALTFDQQIALLKSRGLRIDDEERAKRHLRNVSYYRLSAYMIPFMQIGPYGEKLDMFTPDTTWDNVYDLYKFDRKLRLLVFDAIERIEIALRTLLIYQLSHKYGSHWQNDPSIFMAPKVYKKTGKVYDVYSDIQNHISEQLNANQKVIFIKHYIDTYDDPKTPPSWMSVELLYFNELSKIFQNLKDRGDRINISKSFDIKDDGIFCSWLHTLNYIRNICAHHSRLWNISLAIPPRKYYNRSPKMWFTDYEIASVQSSRMYYSLSLILYLLQTVNPKTKFRNHFYSLINKYPIANLGHMGFPNNWEEHPLWKI
jgi:abortive infection bacteriophage resistance protein